MPHSCCRGWARRVGSSRTASAVVSTSPGPSSRVLTWSSWMRAARHWTPRPCTSAYAASSPAPRRCWSSCTRKPRCPVPSQRTCLGMRQCPLSLWERVRGFSQDQRGPSPPALSRGERTLRAPLCHAQRGCLIVH